MSVPPVRSSGKPLGIAMDHIAGATIHKPSRKRRSST